MDYPLYLSIYYYLTRNGEYPQDCTPSIKRKIRNQARQYDPHGGKLFKKNPVSPVAQELLHEANVEAVIRQVHEEGHYGVNNTWSQLRLQYTGPRLFEWTRRVVQSCIACQVRSKKPHKRTEPAHPIETPSYPFYMVGCDAVGPMEPTESGCRFLLVAVDYLTRWPIALAVPDITEETTADFLFNHVVVPYGVPRFLLTDRGSNFTSGYVREFLKSLNLRHLTTTAYRPQTNGLCERLNQTLTQTLAKIVRDANALTTWDRYVTSALLALRTMRNDSTGHTPSMLLYGYTLRTPATWPAPREDFDESDPLEEIASRVRVITHLVENLRPEARAKSNEQKKKNKVRYDQLVSPRRRFAPGEQVLMRDNNPPHKLADRWLGPMTVTRVNQNGTYHLTGPNYRRLQSAVNGDSLIPFRNHKHMVPDIQVQRAEHQFLAWMDRFDSR
ncbi:hypothetical protein INT47_001513 [Mucor saturninus]|uniref:Integrase catalytic domain-containing protein n=1 Tax=Mucor saturninus TaxID=64648 RepID=A0A8H7QGM9_9FUNG|nr:hypothetical protein INT47_001513 [Mucor saturninus]